MSDTERVFALYVQVNPVPDPDLLPIARHEAELLPIEGSTVMDTRETIEVRPEEQVRRWNPAVVVAAAFVLVLAVVGGVLLLTGSGEAEPVAAADARPLVTFDGESCTYDGPTRITGGTVEFTFVNTSPARDALLVVWRIPGPETLDAELERVPIGSDVAIAPADPTPQGAAAVQVNALPGQSNTNSGPMLEGFTHLADCVAMTGGFNDHAWRVAAIEVVAP